MTDAVKITVFFLTLLNLLKPIVLANEIPDKFTLAKVEFSGIESVSQKELAKTLVSRTPPLWKFWLPSPKIETVDIEDDLTRIRQFYRSEGYYKTEVDVSVTVIEQPTEQASITDEPSGQKESDPIKDDADSPARLPRARVVFSVVEGPPVLVETIEIDIRPSSKEDVSHEVIAALPLGSGKVFRAADYEESKRTIGQFFGNRGHPFAEVTGQAVIDPTANQAKIIYHIDPGPASTFGPVTIVQEGTKLSETVIRRALTFEEGKKYEIKKVESSRRNLIRLDVFRTAIIRPEGPPETAGGPVSMRIELRSKERRSISLGAGYGTEDKLRLRAALTYRNIFSQGGRLSLSGRYSALIRNAQLTYVQPYFLDAKNTLVSRAGHELQEPPAYKNRRTFLDLALNRRIQRYWLFGINYGLSFNKEESVAAVPFDPEEDEFLDQNVRISSIGLEILRDTRDDLLNPMRGSVLEARINLAPDLFGSELTYIQPTVEAKLYQQVYKKFIVAGRIALETIQGIQGTTFIPAFKRLYLGGSDTVRGYDFQRLPPLARNGDPIGGQTGFNASIETRFPLYRELSGVAFLDAGLLDVEPFQLNFSDTLYTCGLGLRYNTVIGPIRVDFGYKLNPLTGKDIGDFSQPNKVVDGRWLLYFNIGQAF
jgi:outer membrane protein assembly complex protein YaeT